MNKKYKNVIAKLPLLAAWMVVVFAAGILINPPEAAAYYSNGVGNGTVGSPYEVSTCAQLSAVQTDPDAYYLLTNNIDCIDTASDASVVSGNFSGSLDGQGYGIYNLTLTNPTGDYLGVFSQLTGSAEIKNLSVYADITGQNNVGLLAGDASDTASIRGVQTNGTVTCANNCGGIVGAMHENASLERSWSTAHITGDGYTFGGLVGWADGDGGLITISDVYFSGGVEPTGGTENYVGGIVGFAVNMALTNARTGGYIESNGEGMGGIAGTLITSSVTNSFTVMYFGMPQIAFAGNGKGVLFGDSILSTTEDNYYSMQATGWSAADDGYGSVGTDSDYFTQRESAVFNTWDFDEVWMQYEGSVPYLKPLIKPYLACGESHATDTTISASCKIMPAGLGWGIPYTAARYQKVGDADWITTYTSDGHNAHAEVTGLEPNTLYALQFQLTNFNGDTEWTGMQILTTGPASAPAADTPAAAESRRTIKSAPLVTSARSTPVATEDAAAIAFTPSIADSTVTVKTAAASVDSDTNTPTDQARPAGSILPIILSLMIVLAGITLAFIYKAMKKSRR